MEDLKKYMVLKFGARATGFVFNNIDKFCDDHAMLTIADFRRVKDDYFKDTSEHLIPSVIIIYRAFGFYCKENDIIFNKNYIRTRNKVSTRYVMFDRNKSKYSIFGR